MRTWMQGGGGPHSPLVIHEVPLEGQSVSLVSEQHRRLRRRNVLTGTRGMPNVDSARNDAEFAAMPRSVAACSVCLECIDACESTLRETCHKMSLGKLRTCTCTRESAAAIASL
jgi:hypothetical protein